MSKKPKIPIEVLRKLQAKTKPPCKITFKEQGYFRLPVFGDVVGIHETGGLLIVELETKTGETVQVPLDQQAIEKLHKYLNMVYNIRNLPLDIPPAGNA